jgi:hypothetical protein
MRLEFDPQALEDLPHWVEADRRKALRIIQLTDQTLRSPFIGPGKPEPLKPPVRLLVATHRSRASSGLSGGERHVDRTRLSLPLLRRLGTQRACLLT